MYTEVKMSISWFVNKVNNILVITTHIFIREATHLVDILLMIVWQYTHVKVSITMVNIRVTLDNSSPASDQRQIDSRTHIWLRTAIIFTV